MRELRAILVLATMSSACGSSNTPLAWRGAAPHFVAQGQVDGSPVAIDLADEAASSPGVLSCQRFYEAPVESGQTVWSEGRLFRLVVDVLVETPAVSQVLRLSLSPEGFPIDAEGSTFTLVPADRQKLTAGQAQLEWAWLDMPALDSTYQATAEGGNVDIDLFSGSPDATGLVVPGNEGALGAVLVAHWSTTDEVMISLSAPCTANQIERIEEAR